MNKLDEINSQIKELEAALQKGIHTKEQVRLLQDQIKKKQKEVKESQIKVNREQSDVDELHHITLQWAIASLLRNKEEKLQKEEQELLDATMKHERLESELQVLQDELDHYKRKEQDVKEISSILKQLYKDKERLLIEAYPFIKDKFIEFDRHESLAKEQLIEIDEALEVGERTRRALGKALDKLQSAKNWGTFDMWSRNSMLSSIQKHRRIDEANTYLSQANAYLRRFKEECKDIKLDVKANHLFMNSTDYTFDVFFDNIFTDYRILEEIRSAYTSCEQSIYRLKTQMKDINALKHKYMDQIDQAQKDKKELIRKA
jgi:hypothetical protein